MFIDVQDKAMDLLETLANAIHDRETINTNPFCFNINEIVVAKKWLSDFIEEVKK